MLLKSAGWHRIRYTLWSPFYDCLASVFNARRRRAIEVAALRHGESVLVVGAGTGLDLDFMPRGVKVTAVDITPAMLARLRRRAARLGLEVEARVMDGRALDFPDATFDVVVLHLILTVIPEPERCIKEAARVLRPGGRAIVFDKFVPDSGPTPFCLRVLNPLAGVFGTEMTRRLGPLVEVSGLQVAHLEASGFRGLIKIALLTKE